MARWLGELATKGQWQNLMDDVGNMSPAAQKSLVYAFPGMRTFIPQAMALSHSLANKPKGGGG
jgi:hypothetical protein